MTAVEEYAPLLQVVGFVGGWAVAMLTGLLFSKVSE